MRVGVGTAGNFWLLRALGVVTRPVALDVAGQRVSRPTGCRPRCPDTPLVYQGATDLVVAVDESRSRSRPLAHSSAAAIPAIRKPMITTLRVGRQFRRPRQHRLGRLKPALLYSNNNRCTPGRPRCPVPAGAIRANKLRIVETLRAGVRGPSAASAATNRIDHVRPSSPHRCRRVGSGGSGGDVILPANRFPPHPLRGSVAPATPPGSGIGWCRLARNSRGPRLLLVRHGHSDRHRSPCSWCRVM